MVSADITSLKFGVDGLVGIATNLKEELICHLLLEAFRSRSRDLNRWQLQDLHPE